MSLIYIYPKTDPATLESANPYIHNLEQSLSKRHTIINTSYLNNRGVLDIIEHFRAEIFILNWIEDLRLKNYGRLQSLAFFTFLIFVKLFRKKIVWILHNKYSHSRNKSWWNKIGFEVMIKYSDLIITHSTEGIHFIKERFPEHVSKVKYIPHPVQGLIAVDHHEEKKYDFLIWGTIYKYKGIIEFLNFMKSDPVGKDLKILIAGKCHDQEYKTLLESGLTDNITYLDEYFELEEIASLAGRSGFVLFTYNSPSVLSSGSLMDSLRMGTRIIGPDAGAFKDLCSCGFIDTYRSYEDIITIVSNQKQRNSSFTGDLQKFCIDNSWDSFIDKFEKEYNSVIIR